MKIILLSGKPHSGKSTALNLLCNKLLECDNWDITPNLDQELGECVLEHDGKTVAIVADGDTYHWLVEAIVKYAYCDVLVLAYSDKFARSPTFKEIVRECEGKRQATDSHNDEFARQLAEIRKRYNGYHCVIEQKEATTSDNEGECNEQVCKEILAQLPWEWC
jgi:tRNA uridine 5-carbamoylmethylation protein Kti12